jgi:hypothetical protein
MMNDMNQMYMPPASVNQVMPMNPYNQPMNPYNQPMNPYD